MQTLYDLPLAVRLSIVALAGVVVGAVVNWIVATWAFFPRPISPWGRGPSDGPPRQAMDRIPLVGWFGLRREAAIFGPGFWIRPLLVEIGCAAALAGLYWWEVACRGLYPDLGFPYAIPASILHQQFLAHAVLMLLMLAASLIDIDEKLIPDEITVRGAVLGLVLATLLPWSLPPQISIAPRAAEPTYAEEVPIAGVQLAQRGVVYAPYVQFVTATAPNDWPTSLAARPNGTSLAVGIGCYWLWIFAMLHRPWRPRRGRWRALQLSTLRALRDLRRASILALLGVGTIGIVVVWSVGDMAWAGLLTALLGLVGAGGMIWIVRVIGAATLKKEAMGFGDVMLMMMVGTFLGWQAGILIFFIAPFFGLLVGLVQVVLRRDQYIPYGPFLCLAAAVVVIRWASIWEWARDIFAAGWLVPAALAGCFAVLAVMLAGLQLVRELRYRQS